MNQKMAKLRKMHPFKWFILSVAIIFYFYEYAVRVSPSILVPELMKTFKVDAASVGIISAFYFYAYAPMQFPVGILADRYGARRLLLLASVICGIGGVMFAVAHSIVTAEIGRLFLGFGSAFVFICMIFIVTHWFEKKQWAVLIGIANSIGMMGAVVGEGPMALAVDHWGFRLVMFVAGLIAFGITLLILLIVKNQPKEFHKEEDTWRPSFWLSMKLIFASRRAWVVAIVSSGYYLAMVAFGALWGVPFFQASNGFSKDTASFATSMIYFGFVIGGPIIGHIADRIGHKKGVMITCLSATIVCLSCLIYLSPMPDGVVFLLTFATGFFCSGQLLTFTLGIQSVSESVKGTMIAFNNGMCFMVGAVIQPVIGAMLDAKSQGGAFTLADFHFAFSIFIVALGVSFLGSFFIIDPSKKAVKDLVKADETLLRKEQREDMAKEEQEAA